MKRTHRINVGDTVEVMGVRGEVVSVITSRGWAQAEGTIEMRWATGLKPQEPWWKKWWSHE